MKLMFLFCMARVAVALAGLAVMAYVALGCTWAAIEETAPIADTDDGACLRVKKPLIAPGECLTGIEHVGPVKFSGTNWLDTNIALPATAEWWLVSPAGAGHAVVSTAALRALDEQRTTETPAGSSIGERVRKSIYIPGPTHGQGDQSITWYVLLGQNSEDELLVWSEQGVEVQIYRVVAAPTE